MCFLARPPRISYSFLLLVCAVSILMTSPATFAAGRSEPSQPGARLGEEKITLGWLQSIRLLPHELRMTAKLDTGAKKSVIHAIAIEPFRQGNREWVRFTVPVEKKKERVELKFELPVEDQSRVKQHHTRELDVRYVVALDFCIDGKLYTADFSLDNRQKFNYPVLLGREFLKHHFLVDSSQTFVKKYNCS